MTPKPPQEEGREEDQTPMNFEDAEKDSSKGKSSSTAAVVDPRALESPSFSMDIPDLRSSVSEVQQSKTFRLYKGPEGFGFSVQASSDESRVVIKGLKEGSVAAKAGMMIDDELQECNGQSLTRLSRDQVIAFLQSIPRFETVTFVVSRLMLKRRSSEEEQTASNTHNPRVTSPGSNSPRPFDANADTVTPTQSALASSLSDNPKRVELGAKIQTINSSVPSTYSFTDPDDG
jgi:hypothetical protein